MAQKRIKLIYNDNGAGLSRDAQVLERLLLGRGFEVGHASPFKGPSSRADYGFDAAFHLEIVSGYHYNTAAKHVLIPNQEWFIRWHNSLHRFAIVFCKSAYAARLFGALGVPVTHVSFTCEDIGRGVPVGEKEYAFLHIAGRSKSKNTLNVIEAWNQHPEWPPLYVFNHFADLSEFVRGENIVYHFGRLEDKALREVQNRVLFTVIPSAAEGFGHVLWEQLSAGSVLLTTDAPPMNEWFRDVAFLCKAAFTPRPHGLDAMREVPPEFIAVQVQRALDLSYRELALLSEYGRVVYEQNDHFFHDRFLMETEKVLYG